MRTTPPFLLLLAACSQPAEKTEPKVAKPDTPVGLYERAGVPDKPSRICIAGQGDEMRFGLNSSYEGPESCTATGSVRESGSVLTLVIDGNPACALAASLTGTGLTLDRPEGTECGYYCGGNTDLNEGPFEKVGDTEADARKAIDLVGEPLC